MTMRMRMRMRTMISSGFAITVAMSSTPRNKYKSTSVAAEPSSVAVAVVAPKAAHAVGAHTRLSIATLGRMPTAGTWIEGTAVQCVWCRGLFWPGQLLQALKSAKMRLRITTSTAVAHAPLPMRADRVPGGSWRCPSAGLVAAAAGAQDQVRRAVRAGRAAPLCGACQLYFASREPVGRLRKRRRSCQRCLCSCSRTERRAPAPTPRHADAAAHRQAWALRERRRTGSRNARKDLPTSARRSDRRCRCLLRRCGPARACLVAARPSVFVCR